MARDQAAEAPRDADLGVEAAVSKATPLVEVKVLDDVHMFHEGNEVAPGDTIWVDGTIAIHLVQQGHGQIVGSETQEAAEKRLAKAAKSE